jgi:predicted enzyme related to lactoylglutathione lyase
MSTAATEFSLSTIGQISVPVADLQRAIRFYREQLRLLFLFEVPGMAFFNCDGIRLLLTLPEQGDAAAKKPDSSILYFKVPDIHVAHEKLQAQGVAFVAKPHLIAPMPNHDLWMAFFHDSEQNLHALMAEMAKIKT